jgi:hypothetical protein
MAGANSPQSIGPRLGGIGGKVRRERLFRFLTRHIAGLHALVHAYTLVVLHIAGSAAALQAHLFARRFALGGCRKESGGKPKRSGDQECTHHDVLPTFPALQGNLA